MGRKPVARGSGRAVVERLTGIARAAINRARGRALSRAARDLIRAVGLRSRKDRWRDDRRAYGVSRATKGAGAGVPIVAGKLLRWVVE
jgi:hypothetical protein